MVRALIGVAALVLLGALLWNLVNPVAALVVMTGLGLIILVTWLPTLGVRILGSLYLGLLLLAILHHFVPLPVAIGIAAAVAVLGPRYLPLTALRKVGFMVPSMVLLAYVTTLLMYSAPGNPFQEEKASTADVLAAKRAKFKVHESANEYFYSYAKDLVFEGSLGLSTKSQGRTVNELLGPALPVSMSLGLVALVLAVALGLFFGMRAGLKPNSAADYTSMAMALVGISLPNFVIGAVLIILFSIKLGWFPVTGWGSAKQMVLPAITLALPYAAYIARLSRGGTIEVMRHDYIRTARAKGLPGRVVVLKHALKGAIMPVISFLGPAAAGIMTGSFVVERLFGIPGMGDWFVSGALNRDYSVVLGTALIYFGIITFFNFIVDLAYAWIDPRTREVA